MNALDKACKTSMTGLANNNVMTSLVWTRRWLSIVAHSLMVKTLLFFVNSKQGV